MQKWKDKKKRKKKRKKKTVVGVILCLNFFVFLLGLCLNSVVKRSKLWWVSFFLGYDFIFFQVLQTLLVTDC